MEILVVIVVLGILATVVLFTMRGVTDRGEQSACVSDARTLTTAADTWMARKSRATRSRRSAPAPTATNSSWSTSG